jgi:DNA-binding NtrC family response regulator
LSVLIVDGDVAVREALAERLCLRGHIVGVATGAAEATAALARGGVDVVVIDGGEGAAAALYAALRGEDRGEGVRWIVIGDASEGGVGADGRCEVLVKPFTAATWVTTVEGNAEKG